MPFCLRFFAYFFTVEMLVPSLQASNQATLKKIHERRYAALLFFGRFFFAWA